MNIKLFVNLCTQKCVIKCTRVSCVSTVCDKFGFNVLTVETSPVK